MVTALLTLDRPRQAQDAYDALALALCHCTVGGLRDRLDAAVARSTARPARPAPMAPTAPARRAAP
jgi:hypothetical protein